jgi:hypothetical protein
MEVGDVGQVRRGSEEGCQECGEGSIVRSEEGLDGWVAVPIDEEGYLLLGL